MLWLFTQTIFQGILCADASADVTGSILLPKSAPNHETDLRVYLYPDPRIAFPDSSGAFTFHQVPQGRYRLQAHCKDWFFHPLVVTIGTDNTVRMTNLKGESLSQNTDAKGIFNIKPHAARAVHTHSMWKDLLSFLLTPMPLMLLTALAMGYLMPLLISEEEMKASMDEIRSNIEAMQKKMALPE